MESEAIYEERNKEGCILSTFPVNSLDMENYREVLLVLGSFYIEVLWGSRIVDPFFFLRIKW